MSWLYLALLLFSAGGLVVYDWRRRVAFFAYPIRSACIVLICVTVFLIWDMFGIIHGIFFYGGSPLTTHIMLAPELPLEEPVFLAFLSYFTLLLWRSIDSLWRTRGVAS